MDDDRFSKAFTDPRFRRPNKKKNKVVIDDRFKGMFTDEKFKSEYKIDKRGRPIHENTSTNMRKFYREENEKKAKKTKKKPKSVQSESTKEDEDAEEKKTETKLDVSAEKIEKDEKSEDESSMSESSSDEEEVDLLRGVGNVESSDFSDDGDDFYKDDNPSEAFDHNWNELDETAPVMDDRISARLAICNMDWDRITAKDLFMLLHSFKPQEGAVHKVSIYPSEFGKERMAEESLAGPKEIRELKEGDAGDKEDEREEEKFHQEVLRQYQLNRLKYYYAVVECDSADTANHIYAACDGQGFETSAVKMDLRFVPDEMRFDDDEPTQVCDQLPDKDLYQPNRFNTTALNQSKVELTWDETDKKRVSLMTKKFTDDDIEGQDLLDYIAPSSDEEEDEDEAIDENEERERPVCGVSRLSTVDQIQQYRSLLLGDMDEENNRDDDDADDGEVHMQTTFNIAADADEGSGLEDSGEESDDESDADSESDGENGESFFAGSGDNDSEDEDEEKEKQKEAERERKEAEAKEKARLALVMMADDEDEEQQQRHFNMDDILKKQQEEGKKKKRRKKRAGGKKDEDDDEKKDDFRIDMDDQRFKGVFSDPQFAIDPNHPSFKPTKAMLELVEEKRKRKSRNDTFQQPTESASKPQDAADENDDGTDDNEKKKENEGKNLAAALSFIKQANARPKIAAVSKAKKATFFSKYVTEFNNYSSDSEDDQPKQKPVQKDTKVEKSKKRQNTDGGVVASKKKKKKQK